MGRLRARTESIAYTDIRTFGFISGSRVGEYRVSAILATMPGEAFQGSAAAVTGQNPPALGLLSKSR